MSKRVTTVTEGTSSNEVMKVVAQTGFNGFPVVRDGRSFKATEDRNGDAASKPAILQPGGVPGIASIVAIE